MILALMIFAVALFAAISELSTREPDEVAPVKLDGLRDAQRIFGGVRQDGDRIGNPQAPITMQFFTDMQCAPCSEQFMSTVPELIDRLVRTGEAQILLRHYSFSRSPIEKGFIAAEAAGEQGYQWQYAYIFFASLDEAERFGIDDEFLRAVAISIPELDVDAWQRDMEQGSGAGGAITESLLRQDDVARGLGLRSEPSVVINGPEETVTVQDSPGLDEILDAVEHAGGPAAG